MKHTAVQSLKFIKLKRRLGLPHYAVVGLLEAMWLFTQTNAPAGDIGRHSNEDIAAGLEWAGDHDRLVADLVACGWLDVCTVNRLVVHDWADHCPRYVKGQVASQGGRMLSAVTESDTESDPAPETDPEDSKPQGLAPGLSPQAMPPGLDDKPPGYAPPQPNLTQPNPTQPNPTQGRRRGVSDSRNIHAGACEPDTGRTQANGSTPDNSRDTVTGSGNPASNRTPIATPNTTTAPATMPATSHGLTAAARSPAPSTLDRASIVRACNSLQKAFADCNIAIDRNWIWRVCWTAAAITAIRGEDMGLVRDWCAGIRSGAIKRPQIYIDTGLAKQASVIGLDHFAWAQTIPKIPDSVQPVG